MVMTSLLDVVEALVVPEESDYDDGEESSPYFLLAFALILNLLRLNFSAVKQPNAALFRRTKVRRKIGLGDKQSKEKNGTSTLFCFASLSTN